MCQKAIFIFHPCFFCGRCVLFRTIYLIRAGFVLDMCVKQNRQVCSGEARGAVSQSQSERRQPTKSQNMSFRHFYIVPSLSVEGSKNINCFFSGFQSISPFFTCGMSCIGNLSVHYLLLFIGCFSVSKQMLKTIQHLKILHTNWEELAVGAIDSCRKRRIEERG